MKNTSIKRLAAFLSANILMQLFGAISGILLARWMEVDEYALYTIMTMVSGAMIILTKGGVNLGLNAYLGQMWPDKVRCSEALSYALSVRKKIALLSLPMILLITGWLLYENGATPVNIALLLALLCLNFICDFHSRLYDQILNFANRANEIQWWDSIFAATRLTLYLFMKALGMLNVFSAVLIAYIALGLRVFPVRKKVNEEINVVEYRGDEYSKIKTIAKRQFPIEVFNVLQAQLILILIAQFGEPENTAAFGAMTRLGQLFLPLTSLLNAYIIPRFCVMEKDSAIRVFTIWSCLSAVPGLFLCSFALVKPELLLLIVGDNYSNYTTEVFWVAIFFLLKSTSIFMWQLLANIGRNRFVYLQIPLFSAWCIFSICYIDLKEFLGILIFQLGFPVVVAITSIVEFYIYKTKIH